MDKTEWLMDDKNIMKFILDMKRPWYIRGCASERGSCDDIRKAHSSHMDIVSLLSCNECVGEKCNTSDGYRSLADMTLALFTVVVTPIMAKYMLS